MPRKEDQWRLILNLKALNAYTIHEHFKMEVVRSVKDLLNRGDYMCKLDLKGCVSVSTNQCSTLEVPPLQWEGVPYIYNALPFGLVSAPWVFTKLLKPVLSHL